MEHAEKQKDLIYETIPVLLGSLRLEETFRTTSMLDVKPSKLGSKNASGFCMPPGHHTSDVV